MSPSECSIQYLEMLCSYADRTAELFGGKNQRLGGLSSDIIMLLGGMLLIQDEPSVQKAIKDLDALVRKISQEQKERANKNLEKLL